MVVPSIFKPKKNPFEKEEEQPQSRNEQAATAASKFSRSGGGRRRPVIEATPANAVFSRPQGTDISQNVRVDNLPEAEAAAIREKNARVGQEIKRLEEEKLQGEAAAEARQLVFPEEEAEKVQAQQEFSEIERRDLDPTLADTTGANIPLIGGGIQATENIIYDFLASGALGENLAARAERARNISPEALQTLARTEVERQVFEEGVTASEKTGAFIEGVPLVGGLVSKYASDIETPSGNIQELVRTIRTERGRATKYESWASQGIIDPAVAQENIENIELDIQRLESRIKLLTNYAPSLRFNSDGINKIEEEILRSREVIGAAKLRAGAGQLTEAQDLAYLEALQSFTDEEEFSL